MPKDMNFRKLEELSLERRKLNRQTNLLMKQNLVFWINDISEDIGGLIKQNY